MLASPTVHPETQVNRLEAFYQPQALQNVFAKLDRVDFRSANP